LALSSLVDFEYQVSSFYQPDSEGGIRWDDPDINIAWPKADKLIISKKDRALPSFAEIKDSLAW